MICPDCRLHLVGHASCELAAERAADWTAIWDAVADDLAAFDRLVETEIAQVWPADLAEYWLGITSSPPLPTPLERALDILAPHLRDQPLYQP